MRAPVDPDPGRGVANDGPTGPVRRVGQMPYLATLDGQMSRKAQYVQAR